jgi:hypothetical protein
MSPAFAYVQARVQARFGALIDDTLCHRLAADRGLSSFLEEARGTPLAHWVAGFSRFSDTHHIEQGLRQRFHDLIRETAGWVPEEWRDAVIWIAWLPELPLLRHLLKGDAAPPWATAGPLLGPRLREADNDIHRAVHDAGGGALLPEVDETWTPETAWVTHWHTLWPACSRPERDALEQLIALTRSHGAAFAATRPDQGWQERLGFRTQLRRLFRRGAMQPVALFAYLALVATDLERLRGTLVNRATYAGESVPG